MKKTLKEKIKDYLKGLKLRPRHVVLSVALVGAGMLSVDNAEANTFTMETTHYTADCYGCSGITAYGYDVRGTIYADGYRVVAVDTNMIPLGSILYVETPYESFYAIAGDTGGAINGNIIDVLVGTQWEAMNKGRVYSTVTVVEWGGY